VTALTDSRRRGKAAPLRYQALERGDHLVKPRVWLAEMPRAIKDPTPAQPFDCEGSFKAFALGVFALGVWASELRSFRNGLSGVQITAIAAPEVLD
jgi:hypothetical protein